jgi:hypothetical protein
MHQAKFFRFLCGQKRYDYVEAFLLQLAQVIFKPVAATRARNNGKVAWPGACDGIADHNFSTLPHGLSWQRINIDASFQEDFNAMMSFNKRTIWSSLQRAGLAGSKGTNELFVRQFAKLFELGIV